MTPEYANSLSPTVLASKLVELAQIMYSPDPIAATDDASFAVTHAVFSAESPLSFFQNLYDNLSSKGKNSFRQSLGIALRHAPEDGSYPIIVRDFIYLIGFTEAYESLDAISITLADASRWSDARPELYINALAVLKGLAKSPHAYETCRTLVTAPHFPQRYIFDAYEVLAIGAPFTRISDGEPSPANWAIDLIWLANRFRAAESWKPTKYKDKTKSWFDSRLQMMVADTIEQFSLHTVLNGLRYIEVRSTHLDIREVVGKILIIMFGPTGAFRRVAETDGSISLFHSNRPSIRAPWPLDFNGIDTYLWSLGCEDFFFGHAANPTPSNSPEVQRQFTRLGRRAERWWHGPRIEAIAGSKVTVNEEAVVRQDLESHQGVLRQSTRSNAMT